MASAWPRMETILEEFDAVELHPTPVTLPPLPTFASRPTDTDDDSWSIQIQVSDTDDDDDDQLAETIIVVVEPAEVMVVETLPGDSGSATTTGPITCFADTPYHELRQIYFGHIDDSYEDIDLPVVLLVHHVGRPIYRLVLDVLSTYKQMVAMFNQWHGQYHRTPWHGSFTIDRHGNIHCALRWFISEENLDQNVTLVLVQLKPLSGYRGLYKSECKRITALRLFNLNGAWPADAAHWATLVDDTICERPLRASSNRD